jgi:hypothetical protein
MHHETEIVRVRHEFRYRLLWPPCRNRPVGANAAFSYGTTNAFTRAFASALMNETPPDRLSVDPASPFYEEELLARGVGVRFKGVEKTNVEEYCVSEGWVRLAAGKAKDRQGNPVTLKLKGPVEVYFRDAEA